MTKALFVFDIGGSECISTLDAESATLNDVEIAVKLRSFMENTWCVYMATQCTFREIRFGEVVRVSDTPGTGETNALPATCALIVQKNTGTSVRGRMFLPGLAEADCDAGGRVGTELRGLVDGLFASELADLEADGVLCKVVSEGGAGSATTITDFTCRPTIAVLRNRLVGR